MSGYTILGKLTKTITIRDEVYEKLLRIRREDESFSELIDRLADSLDPVETLKRLRGAAVFRDREKMLSEITATRDNVRC